MRGPKQLAGVLSSLRFQKMSRYLQTSASNRIERVRIHGDVCGACRLESPVEASSLGQDAVQQAAAGLILLQWETNWPAERAKERRRNSSPGNNSLSGGYQVLSDLRILCLVSS